jgi:hypothetical protein
MPSNISGNGNSLGMLAWHACGAIRPDYHSAATGIRAANGNPTFTESMAVNGFSLLFVIDGSNCPRISCRIPIARLANPYIGVTKLTVRA